MRRIVGGLILGMLSALVASEKDARVEGRAYAEVALYGEYDIDLEAARKSTAGSGAEPGSPRVDSHSASQVWYRSIR